MKYYLLFLLGLFSFSSCLVTDDPTEEAPFTDSTYVRPYYRDYTTDNTPNSAQYTYLALGDSYTIGEGVSRDERWSHQLVERLQSEGISIADPKIVAATGWTTRDLLEAIPATDEKYAMVSLLIGVNNQFREMSKDEFRTELRVLLQSAIKLAAGDTTNVFVLSIPDWSVTPYAANLNSADISNDVNAFNGIIKDETEKLKITYVDISAISRKALNDPTMVAGDGLHFSGAMYLMWADEAYPIALDILSN